MNSKNNLYVFLGIFFGCFFASCGRTKDIPVKDILFNEIEQKTLRLDNRREIFADCYLIDRLDGLSLRMHEPHDEGPVLYFDRTWEGAHSAYTTVIRDTDRFRLYYRGEAVDGADGNDGEVTCYAESKDGVHWERPDIGLYPTGSNVILAEEPPLSHNFSPFADTKPGISPSERYKALSGTVESGLVAWVSSDGIRWKKKQDKPVMEKSDYDWAFDSQNVAFWSEHEQRYVCYFRTFYDGYRTMNRAVSDDFIHWSKGVQMTYGDTPREQLYTNQTAPYFRAPHIYVAIGGRFMEGRRVLTDEQTKALHLDGVYYNDCSDVYLMITRGGNEYIRTFMESFIRPGIGMNNWVSRTNYPALNVIQTGENEMSLYVNQDYAQPTAHLRRYSMRLDGFSSLSAPFAGGEMLTKYFTFSGNRLEINYATSSAGGLKFEIQDEAGTPVPGYTMEDADEIIGNEIARFVSWKGKTNVQPLASRKIRLRVRMKDADLYSVKFD